MWKNVFQKIQEWNISFKIVLYHIQDCAGVILYTAENATQVALQALQCLGNFSGYVYGVQFSVI